MGSTYSSLILGTLGRFYQHTVIAYRKRMSIGAVVLVARTLKALRYSSVHSRFFYIRHRRVEY